MKRELEVLTCTHLPHRGYPYGEFPIGENRVIRLCEECYFTIVSRSIAWLIKDSIRLGIQQGVR